MSTLFDRGFNRHKSLHTAAINKGSTLISTVYPVRLPQGMFWYRGAAAAVMRSDSMEFSTRNLSRICKSAASSACQVSSQGPPLQHPSLHQFARKAPLYQS